MFKCNTCKLEHYAPSGGWASMHDNFTCKYNMRIFIKKNEIYEIDKEIIKKMEDSLYVDNNEDNVDRLIFCIYNKLFHINEEVALEFGKRQRKRIERAIFLILQDINEEIRERKREENKVLKLLERIKGITND